MKLIFLIVVLLYATLFSCEKRHQPAHQAGKMYLHHPNLMYSLNPEDVPAGTVRESFLLSQLAGSHTLHYPKTDDFLVDRQYLIEVGGKNRNFIPD